MRFFLTGRLIQKAYILVAGTGLVLGFLGQLKVNAWELSSIPGVTLYALHLFIPRHAEVLDGANWMIRTGAFFCGISGFLAAGLLWIAAANRSVSDIWTQYFRRGHILVIGDGDFATRFADTLRKTGHAVVHAVKPATSNDGKTHPARRPILSQDPNDLAAKAGLLRAQQIVVDIGSDTDNLAAATSILARINNSETSDVQDLAIRVSDPILSDQFFETAGQSLAEQKLTPSVFNENLILARDALTRDPLFMRASARDQNRVHALIVGFGDLGEKLMDQVMLTSIARELGTPRVSILDQNAHALRQNFEARRPRVLDQLPISFFQINIGQDNFDDATVSQDIEALLAAEAEDPFTMIYLALPSQGEVTRVALLLDRVRQRNGHFKSPIAYRCRLAAEGEDFLVQSIPSLASDHGFLRICMPAAAIAQAILNATEADRIAVRIHEAYRKSDQASSDADRPWSELKDTYKRSNRRTLDHLPAKLWTAGVRPELNSALTAVDRKILQDILDGPNDSDLMQQLSRLEHDRWCIDRRLDGWAYAKERDNTRRLHDRLIPYDKLVKLPGEVEKDIGHIRELFEIVLNDVK